LFRNRILFSVVRETRKRVEGFEKILYEEKDTGESIEQEPGENV